MFLKFHNGETHISNVCIGDVIQIVDDDGPTGFFYHIKGFHHRVETKDQCKEISIMFDVHMNNSESLRCYSLVPSKLSLMKLERP